MFVVMIMLEGNSIEIIVGELLLEGFIFIL